jgi:hypothetical protein
MICVCLSGGLGNQMFQYALAKSLSLRNNCSILLDTSELLDQSKLKLEIVRSLELEIFDIPAKVASVNDLRNYKPIFFRILNSIACRLGFRGLTLSSYYIEQNFLFDKRVFDLRKNCFISGFWQSPLYFNHIESLIRKDFQFKNVDGKANIIYLNNITKFNSVSIHFRRGDFLNSELHGIHGTCSIDYYQSAISYIKSKIFSPVFFIFSDDVPWVQSNIKLEADIHFVTGNNFEKSYLDMYLMSQCQHNIIANSSFSWWGAWLNDNPSKIVIAPKIWFVDKNLNKQTGDLIPDTWVRL